MANMNFTKHCSIAQVIGEKPYWRINLIMSGASLPDEFSHGLPLAFQFENQELAYNYAKDHIDPFFDDAIEEIREFRDAKEGK